MKDMKDMNFEDYWDCIDDKFDGMHYFMKYIKFGFGRTTDDTSHEIREGHISRDEAIALIKKYDGEFPQKYFQEFLDYIEINEDEFWRIADSWRLEHIWERKGQKNWSLISTLS